MNIKELRKSVDYAELWQEVPLVGRYKSVEFQIKNNGGVFVYYWIVRCSISGNISTSKTFKTLYGAKKNFIKLIAPFIS